MRSREDRVANGRRWWREPLVQFCVIGALLFLVFDWRGGGRPGSNRIVVTPGQVEALAAGFTRTWLRPPDARELKALVDEYVREEIATREAMAMGLDRDDTVIRRRLRQKFEFLAEDAIDAKPPTDADLRAWIAAHPETFHLEPMVAFRQVYLSAERRGAAMDADVRRVLDELAARPEDADVAPFTDSAMLPTDVALSRRFEVAAAFGEAFADAVLQLEPGRWSGPVRSGYGLHLVLLRERVDRRPPDLEEVRAEAEREFLNARRTRELERMYERLLGRYRVTIEVPSGLEAAEAPAAGGGAR